MCVEATVSEEDAAHFTFDAFRISLRVLLEPPNFNITLYPILAIEKATLRHFKWAYMADCSEKSHPRLAYGCLKGTAMERSLCIPYKDLDMHQLDVSDQMSSTEGSKDRI